MDLDCEYWSKYSCRRRRFDLKEGIEDEVIVFIIVAGFFKSI